MKMKLFPTICTVFKVKKQINFVLSAGNNRVNTRIVSLSDNLHEVVVI